MILSEEKRQEMAEAAKPLVKFLCENFHPHVYVIVEPSRVELIEGIATATIAEFIRD